MRGATSGQEAVRLTLLLNRLWDFSLIRYIPPGGQNTEAAETFWVHPLVHDWERVRLPKRDVDAVELVRTSLQCIRDNTPIHSAKNKIK